MPIPDQTDYGDRLGIPAAYGPQTLTNRLRTGTQVHYVRPADLVHVSTIILNVRPDKTPVEISVQQLVNGKPTEFCNVKYDDQTFAAGTWHFPSDG